MHVWDDDDDMKEQDGPLSSLHSRKKQLHNPKITERNEEKKTNCCRVEKECE